MDEESLKTHLRANLQPASPALDGLDVAAAAVSADKVGGDFYDCIPTPDNRLVVALGDVSGSGWEAAVNAVRTQAYLRALAAIDADPGEMLTRVNQLWAAHRLNNRFATLFCARIDRRAQSLVHAGAGEVGYRWSRRDGISQLVSTACPVGIRQSAEVPSGGTTEVLPGDVVFAVSNGMRQAVSPRGDVFEMKRIFDVVADNDREPAEGIVQALHAAAADFQQGPPRDDMTAVVVKLLP